MTICWRNQFLNHLEIVTLTKKINQQNERLRMKNKLLKLTVFLPIIATIFCDIYVQASFDSQVLGIMCAAHIVGFVSFWISCYCWLPKPRNINRKFFLFPILLCTLTAFMRCLTEDGVAHEIPLPWLFLKLPNYCWGIAMAYIGIRILGVLSKKSEQSSLEITQART